MLTSLTSTPASFLYCATIFFQPASCPGTVEIQNVSDLEVPPEPDPDPQAESIMAPAVATAARGTRRRMPPRPRRRERRTPTVVIFDPFSSYETEHGADRGGTGAWCRRIAFRGRGR